MVRRKRSASFEKKYLYLDKDFFEELSFPVVLHLHFQLCMIFQKQKTLSGYLDKQIINDFENLSFHER